MRPGIGPEARSEPPRVRVDGITVTVDGPEGPSSIGGLTLVVDAAGLTLIAPDSGHVRAVPWSTVTSAELRLTGSRPVGEVALDVVSGGRVAHLGLPSVVTDAQMAALSGFLGQPERHLRAPLWPVGPPSWQSRGHGFSDRPLVRVLDFSGKPRHRPRVRRTGLLVAAVLMIGIGTAIGLVVLPVEGPTAPSGPSRSGDQQLADRLMLTEGDLPSGWTTAPSSPPTGGSTHDRSTLAHIVQTFASCMAVSPTEASVALGGPGPDQTAQSSSPVFVGPVKADSDQSGLELQTTASIVRVHSDQVEDFTVVASARFPVCNGEAMAGEIQLGAGDATGAPAVAGPPTSSFLAIPPFGGEQLVGVDTVFDVLDRQRSVPVQVDQAMIGTGRIEAELQMFAVGVPFPSDAFWASLATFEQRVASGGEDVTL